ncbi:hypothetical protein [Shinella sp.]|uniref:hypothetical protein n=1 Tax=Shinella sp. TaxID=1870904 RepID=UPI003D2A10F5
MINSGFSQGDLANMDQQKKRQLLAQALMGQAGQTRRIDHPMQGLAQMAEGAMAGNEARNAMFPQAPGGQKPGFGMSLMNMITRGNNGGMY